MPFLTQGKTNWKYIIIVLLFAVIIGAGVLGLIKKEEITPSKFPEIEKQEKVVEDETANWKAYQSSGMGFFIKYPPKWEIFSEERTIRKGVEGESIGTEFFYTDDQGMFSGIVIIKGPGYPEDLSIEKIATEYKNEVLSEEFPERKEEKEEILMFAGVPSIKFCGITREEEQYCDVVVPTKEKIFVVKCFSEANECTSTFNQILSTFRFLE